MRKEIQREKKSVEQLGASEEFTLFCCIHETYSTVLYHSDLPNLTKLKHIDVSGDSYSITDHLGCFSETLAVATEFARPADK